MKVDKLDFGDGSPHVTRRDLHALGYIYAMTGLSAYDWKPTKDMYLNHFTLRLA